MKTKKMIWVAWAVVVSLSLGSCSRSNDEPAKPTVAGPTPNLRLDAQRLRDATAKAAEARKREEAAAAAAKGMTGSPSDTSAATTPAP